MRVGASLLGGVALAATIYVYGLARNRGAVPPWIDQTVGYAWAAMVLMLALTVAPWRERRLVGDCPRGRFSLEPGERLLFKGRFMSGSLYRPAQRFNPRPTLRQWLSEGGIYIRGLLKVDLTTERFAFGNVAGPMYRVLPLTDIERWSEVEGKWPHRHEVYIEYRYAGYREGILVWTKSGDGRRFKEALRSAVPQGK